MSTAHTIRLSNGRLFSATEGQTVLDAAAHAGLVLEHSCRTGRCGACKTQLLSGTIKALMPDLTLTPKEQSAGWFLSCTSAPCTDLQLDTEDLGPLADIKVLTVPARIDALTLLADDVMGVTLRLPPNQSLHYLAGQYINVIGAGGVKRAYSIANAPRPDGRIELHIKRVSNGLMSQYWFEGAKLNDLLRIEGPRGSFFLRDDPGGTLVLLATGTGYAPIRALLQAVARRPLEAQPAHITVYWGGRQAQDLYEACPDLPGLRSKLHWVRVLSRAAADWTGERGHVQQVLAQRQPQLTGVQVYACGSSAMIRDARAVCLGLGVAPKQFFSDAFVAA